LHSIAARRPVALAGAAAAVVYVIAASVSGALSPLARLPLLDGVHNTAPYSWVNTPPGEQPGDRDPVSINERLDLPAAGNVETIIATGDDQVSVKLPDAAIKPAEGRRQAEVQVEPFDHTTYTAPAGYVIRGNVYRVGIREVPSGKGIPTIEGSGQITMTYAAPTQELLNASHDLMFSSDGQDWRVLNAQDQHATLSVTAPFIDIGYFAAVAKIPEDDLLEEEEGGGFPWLILVVVAVAAGAGFAVTLRLRKARAEARRREQIRRELARQSRSTKKRRR